MNEKSAEYKKLVLELAKVLIGVIATGNARNMLSPSTSVPLVLQLLRAFKGTVSNPKVIMPIAGAIVAKPALIVGPLTKLARGTKHYLGFGDSKSVILAKSGQLSKLNHKELGLVVYELCKHPTVEIALFAVGVTTVTAVTGYAVMSIYRATLIQIMSDSIKKQAIVKALAELKLSDGPFSEALSRKSSTKTCDPDLHPLTLSDCIKERNLREAVFRTRVLTIEEELIMQQKLESSFNDIKSNIKSN